ncbi:hypothetical protein MMC25_004983 [Agyrium rufum]|nr:hypothetical protein [Agyrium rufum]
MSLPPPPPGLDLTENKQPLILAVNITCMLLAVLVLGLRVFSRRISNAKFWWDDWFMVNATVFSCLIALESSTYMVIHGLGKHVWVGPPDALVVWAKGLFIAEYCYTVVICSIKFSLLAFYWRIFKVTTIRIPIYVIGGVVTCWGIAVLLVSTFQCAPVNGFWNKTIGAKCIDTTEFFVANSIPNIITDAAILILPIPYIWQLHLPRNQKLMLSSIFILGIFVVAVSIARINFVVNLDLTSPDLTWNFVDTQIWTCIETNVGIICGCLPSLRPLLTLITTGSAKPNTRPSIVSSKRSGWSRQQSEQSGSSIQKSRLASNSPDKMGENDTSPIMTRVIETDGSSAEHVSMDNEGNNHGVSHADRGIALSPMRRPQGGIIMQRDIEVEFSDRDRGNNMV